MFLTEFTKLLKNSFTDERYYSEKVLQVLGIFEKVNGKVLTFTDKNSIYFLSKNFQLQFRSMCFCARLLNDASSFGKIGAWPLLYFFKTIRNSEASKFHITAFAIHRVVSILNVLVLQMFVLCYLWSNASNKKLFHLKSDSFHHEDFQNVHQFLGISLLHVYIVRLYLKDWRKYS